MTDKPSQFPVGIDFASILSAISKQIYETPFAFLRENVQNAIDAVRIQSLRDKSESDAEAYRIDVEVTELTCRIRDNGIGMSRDDLRQFFWTIGASGKKTDEARAAGCVGMFGIGGFANFGVCTDLTVVSQTEGAPEGLSTYITEAEISAAKVIPNVSEQVSCDADPRGTLVVATFRESANVDELRQYLTDFVRIARERIYFNGTLISRQDNQLESRRGDAIGETSAWVNGELEVNGRLFETEDNVLSIAIAGLRIGDEPVRATGTFRFENGPIDLYKRGFKLCATKVGTSIGVSGSLDCDKLSPTAGRDSLDAESAALLNTIVTCVERVAVRTVLKSPARIAQHTRVFRYVLQQGWTEHLGCVEVRLADGSDTSLGDIRRRASGGVHVYFSARGDSAVAEVMHARGHIVVVMPGDRNKERAVRIYLESLCSAKKLDGVVECTDRYEDLDRFERVFLAELESTIESQYEVENYDLVAGALTEDVPVFAKGHSKGSLTVFVDVRHPEIAKLRDLGISPLLQSMVGRFCREFLGNTLKTRSAKFFGDGGINLGYLARKRSELWILLADDVEVHGRRTTTRAVVRSTDVVRVEIGSETETSESSPRKPKIIQIVGDAQDGELEGYYIRIPDRATRVFGDVVTECDTRGVVWAGNKILFVASDTLSTAFQVEVRMDHIIVVKDADGERMLEGARELLKPVQTLHEGIYFPIPQELESALIPHGDDEIRIEISCDLMDLKSAKSWEAGEGDNSDATDETGRS